MVNDMVSAERTRKRQAPEQTRRQILDAAFGFLRENSFRELSVDALMAHTGHTRTVFYRHFDDVPALILVLIQEVGAELIEVAGEWAKTDRVSAEEAARRLARFVDFYARNGPLVHAVAEAAHHDQAVEEAYNGMIEGFVALTASAIEARIASGELAPLDAPEIARALVRMLNGYLDDSLGRANGKDPERVLETVVTIWTRVLFPGDQPAP
jgi:TetR/AcrR family transcriptional regulator, ethionamide resistance regulator